MGVLGAGATFTVALVQFHGELRVAKRLSPSARVDAATSPSVPHAIDRERLVLDRWRHPNAPAMVAAGEDAFGPYLVETLLVARGLDNWTSETEGGTAPSPGNPMRSPPTLPQRVRVARNIVRVVQALHAVHTPDGAIVHADLSPSNLMVARDSEVGLIDFGASGLSGSRTFGPIGRGTLPYVAPELCRAEQPPSQDTDRYAAAVIVAELLTGERLCGARTDASRLLSIGERGHDLSALERAGSMPTRVREALRELLAAAPADRAPTLHELAWALDSWVDAGHAAS